MPDRSDLSLPARGGWASLPIAKGIPERLFLRHLAVRREILLANGARRRRGHHARRAMAQSSSAARGRAPRREKPQGLKPLSYRERRGDDGRGVEAVMSDLKVRPPMSAGHDPDGARDK